MSEYLPYVNEVLNGLKFCFEFLKSLGDIGSIVLVVISVTLAGLGLHLLLTRVVDL